MGCKHARRAVTSYKVQSTQEIIVAFYQFLGQPPDAIDVDRTRLGSVSLFSLNERATETFQIISLENDHETSALFVANRGTGLSYPVSSSTKVPAIRRQH